MTIGTIDYASSYFKYKTPTPIRGIPTHKALKRLKTELQANASSVETDLGGGDHGCLGLVLTDAEHASVPNTEPFVAPNHPNALVMPQNATAIEALQLKEAHAEQKRAWLECKNVEKALLRHTQDALEDKHTEALVDDYTNLITDDTPTVLTHLFYNCGKVSSEEVAQKEQEVMTMTWLPSDPIALLARPLEQLKKLAAHAGIPHADQQILEKGLTLIRATRDFEYGLTLWEAKPAAQKNWQNFKNHFHEQQLNLKKIRGPTMQQAGYHHANSLAPKISSDIQEQFSQRDTQLLAMLQSLPQVQQENLAPENSNENVQVQSNNQAAYSTMQTDNTQLEILRVLQELRTDMHNMRQSNSARNKERNVQRNNGPFKKTPDEAGQKRTNISKYCWTHGACAHGSAECPWKAPGHQASATFENKMGGSCARCN